MNNKEIRAKMQQYAELTPEHPATTIQRWRPQQCQDCGLICESQRVVRITRLKISGWRKYCTSCSCYYNPDTQAWDQKYGSVSHEEKLAANKKRYQLKQQLAQPEPCPNDLDLESEHEQDSCEHPATKP